MSDDPKRVFCKDCRNYGGFQERYILGARNVWPHACLIGIEDSNPIQGEYELPVNAETKNSRYNCRDFEPLPPKRPWWRFW